MFNSKTDFYNSATDEYRKIPLHPYLVDVLKAYITDNDIGKDDYIFFPKPNKKEKKYGKVIRELYRRVKIKEKMQETNSFLEAVESIDENGLEAEMKEKNITFYSCRHTFETLLATMYKDQSVLIDYFMGHKTKQAMFGNYLHINELDPSTFWNQYGKLLIDFQATFLPSETTKERKDIVAEAIEENKHLFAYREDGSVFLDENAVGLLGNSLAKRIRKPKVEADDDDFFDSV